MPGRLFVIGVIGVVATLAATLLSARDIEPPSVELIQAAYANERTAGRIEHDESLRVTSAQCAASDSGYLCWVTYRTAKMAEQVFDVVDLQRQRSGWKLASGLCLPAADKSNGSRGSK